MPSALTPRRSPIGFAAKRLALAGLSCLLMIGAFGFAPKVADAGSDDFEFGQALIAEGKRTGDEYYFELARKVFESMLADGSASTVRKEEAKYGLAVLKRGQAEAAGAQRDVPYDDVKKLFDEAIRDIENFVKNNPSHSKADSAKFEAGMLRLAFVQWARDTLLESDELMDARGTNTREVQSDAQRYVVDASNHFDSMRTGWDDYPRPDGAAIAQYYYVVCQYYKALVQDRCTGAAKQALKNATLELEDFIGYFDGDIVALYAQDFQGLTSRELAECADTEEERLRYYRDAIMWFETCTESPHLNNDTLVIIARGYYHIGETCLKAGRVGGENFLRRGSAKLSKMLERNAYLTKVDNGIRAILVHAQLEARQDKMDEAIRIANEAATIARSEGKGYLVAEANALLAKFVSGGDSGGAMTNLSPTVLKRVADAEYSQGRYPEAIAAYQKVIRAMGPTPAAFMEFGMETWSRISACYDKMGDLLGAAMALEPIHEAWMDGRIISTREEGDQALETAGNKRLKSISMLDELQKSSGSSALRARQRAMDSSFGMDYRGHTYGRQAIYRSAFKAFKEGSAKKREGNSGWKSDIEKAERGFEQVIAQPEITVYQQWSHVYLIRIANLREDWAGVIRRGEAALQHWESDKVTEAAKTSSELAAQVAEAQGKARFYMSKAYVQKKDYDKVLELLDNYVNTYPDLEPYFLGGALAHQIEAHLAKENRQQADRLLAEMRRKFPTDGRLSGLTFDFAKFYKTQYSAVADEYFAARRALMGDPSDPAKIGLRKELVQTRSDEDSLRVVMSNTRSGISILQEQIKYWTESDSDDEDIRGGVKREDYEAAKKNLPIREKNLQDQTREVAELAAKAQQIEQDILTTTQQMAELKAKMYPFLKKAADYYRSWDEVRKGVGAEREPSNVKLFADYYEDLTRLDPSVEENWQFALSLYEDYLSLTEGRESEPKVRDARGEVLGSLGRIYSRQASVVEDETQKRQFVEKAVDLLQGSMAHQKENTELVLMLLDEKLVVLPWHDRLSGEDIRVAVPRSISTVAEFKAALEALGKTGGTPLPVFESDKETRDYRNAAKRFGEFVDKMSTRDLERTIATFATAAVDAHYYAMLANRKMSFRLALARGYAESPEAGHARRAINLVVYTLIDSPYQIPEDEPEWWEAQAILLQAYISHVEPQIPQPGNPPSAEVKDMLELASKRAHSLIAADPGLGETAIPGSAETLKKLFTRINELRQLSSMGIEDFTSKLRAVPESNGNDDPEDD